MDVLPLDNRLIQLKHKLGINLSDLLTYRIEEQMIDALLMLVDRQPYPPVDIQAFHSSPERVSSKMALHQEMSTQ